MGEPQFVAIHPVLRHQQPSCEAFLNLAAPIGEGCLGRLNHERVSSVQHDTVQRSAGVDCSTHLVGGDALTVARKLHVRLVRSPVVVLHHNRQAGHTFATNDADFDGRPPSATTEAKPLSGK